MGLRLLCATSREGHPGSHSRNLGATGNRVNRTTEPQERCGRLSTDQVNGRWCEPSPGEPGRDERGREEAGQGLLRGSAPSCRLAAFMASFGDLRHCPAQFAEGIRAEPLSLGAPVELIELQ